jgi:hypothetical protein
VLTGQPIVTVRPILARSSPRPPDKLPSCHSTPHPCARTTLPSDRRAASPFVPTDAAPDICTPPTCTAYLLILAPPKLAKQPQLSSLYPSRRQATLRCTAPLCRQPPRRAALPPPDCGGAHCSHWHSYECRIFLEKKNTCILYRHQPKVTSPKPASQSHPTAFS